MPKKKSKTEQKDTEKDKILEEIAKKLKEIQDKDLFDEGRDEEESEKFGLEEDIDIGALGFDQFIQPMHLEDIRAPVLERIAGSQAGPIFVGGIPQTQAIPGEEKESDEFKYVSSPEADNEPKYIEPDSRISREPERVDFARLGREPTEIIPKANQEAFFMRSEPSLQNESPTTERAWTAERFDIEKAGREDPFKKEEIKYEKYRPKPPKSY